MADEVACRPPRGPGRAQVGWLGRPKRRYLVAAELKEPDTPRAHAVGDVGPVTAARGMALCGLPAEELVIVPNLAWEQVEQVSRCALCQTALSVDVLKYPAGQGFDWGAGR